MATSPSTLDNNLTAGGTNAQGLSDWAAPYITDYLGKAKALSTTPYEVYKGPLTAGSSDLQNKAFEGISSLTVPGAIGNAATAAGKAGANLAGMSYTPTSFSNKFQAPSAYQAPIPGYTAPVEFDAFIPELYSDYQAPDVYQAANFTNQYQAPTAYKATDFTNEYKAPSEYQASNVTNQYKAPQDYKSVGSTFDSTQLQQYMNPYLQASLNPQLEEARRQAQITQMQNAAKMSSAGGFGGGRQAIMDAETQRNLGTNLANITGQGYNTAFNQAQTQFNADQARKIQEAQYGAAQGMTAAQLQAQFGLSADQANEASRQFGAQQKMTASQLAAQYGLSAQQATEASKQFGSQQGMTAAQLQAQYGLSADQANEMSRQFGAGQAMTASQLAAQFGLSADQATEASKQFGARFGLDANNAALSAAQTQGNLGALQNQTNLANINTQLTGGSVQRGVESEGVAADLAEFEKQRQFPYQQLDYMRNAMTGLPTSSVSNTPAQMSDIGNILSSLGGGTKVAEALGYKDVGSLLKKLGLDLGP